MHLRITWMRKSFASFAFALPVLSVAIAVQRRDGNSLFWIRAPSGDVTCPPPTIVTGTFAVDLAFISYDVVPHGAHGRFDVCVCDCVAQGMGTSVHLAPGPVLTALGFKSTDAWLVVASR